MRRNLNIDRPQQHQIEKSAEQLQQEFERELAELRSRYRDKLLEALSAEQTRELWKLLGDESWLHATKIVF